MANYEATKYNFDGANLTDIEGVNTGLIIPWGDSTAPEGFLECDGSAVSQSTYANLFAVIGTTYGDPGGGNFNLPDLTDRVVVSRSPSFALASTGGANAVTGSGNVGGNLGNTTITTPTLAAHTHPGGNMNPPGADQASGDPGAAAGFGSASSSLGPAGGGGGHSHPLTANFSGGSDSVLQPYAVVMYVIKT